MDISPELQQGIVNLLYFTWLHNAEMLAYAAGTALSILLLIKQPRRSLVFLLLGFSVLMIEFQYVKHIVEPLLDQTMQTVLETGAQATRFSSLLRLLLSKILPLGLYVVGWGSIFLAILALSQTSKGVSNDRKPDLS